MVKLNDNNGLIWKWKMDAYLHHNGLYEPTDGGDDKFTKKIWK